MQNRRVGDAGERIAELYYQSLGGQVLERNYTVRGGEIDLIVRLDGTYVFVEVKRRQNARFGEPEEAVTYAKMRRISRAALIYLQRNGLLDQSVRFDVVAISEEGVRHIPAAFDYIGI